MKLKLTFEIELDGNNLNKIIKGNYDTYTEYFDDLLNDVNLFDEATDFELDISDVKLISAEKTRKAK